MPGDFLNQLSKRGDPILHDLFNEIRKEIKRNRTLPTSSDSVIQTPAGRHLIPKTSDAGVAFATAPAGGIAARSGATVSSGTCTLHTWDGTTYGTAGETVTVYNAITEAVPASASITIGRWKGSWWVLGWTCT